MKNLYKILTLVIVCLLSQSCNDYPVDDNGLLVTDSEECYISSLILRGPDDRDVLISGVTIDDENNTITGIAKFGTNIKKLKPECGTAKDCIVTPTMGVWTDFSQPRQYTVISGNRQVKKTYTVTITLQERAMKGSIAYFNSFITEYCYETIEICNAALHRSLLLRM